MEELLKEFEETINKKYLEIKNSSDIESEIWKIYRVLRWTEPELAKYVKKRLEYLAKKIGNS